VLILLQSPRVLLKPAFTKGRRHDGTRLAKPKNHAGHRPRKSEIFCLHSLLGRIAKERSYGEVDPHEDKGRRDCDTDGGPIQGVASHPGCQLEGAASRGQHGAKKSEIGRILLHFIGDLDGEQGQQHEHCGAPDSYPPTASAPSAIDLRVSCHCLASMHGTRAGPSLGYKMSDFDHQQAQPSLKDGRFLRLAHGNTRP
jgi:hypothetical protein